MITHPAWHLRTALGALIVAAAVVAGGSYALAGDDAKDQALARKALLEGRIRPLAEITERVAPQLPGKILGVEIEVEKSGRIVYEFDVVDTAGLLKEVDVDAATAEILSIEDDD